jgi:hypothetical protein
MDSKFEITKGKRMNQDMDTLKYFMASEKVVSMIFTIEQTLEFLLEYSIKPDEEVKKALKPIIDDLRKWIDG